MARTHPTTPPGLRPVDKSDPQRKIWTLHYGPCFCVAHPASGRSFDFVRFRTSTLNGTQLRVNVLVVSDRVIDGSLPMFHMLLDQVPSPRLVLSAAACPRASRFWDALPVGWTPTSEFLHLDGHIPDCIRGNPEVLASRVLSEHAGLSIGAETA